MQHVFDVLAGDLVGGTRPNVVGADQVEGFGLLLLGEPVQAGEHLLRRFLAGVEHVLRLFQAFIEGRVVEQAIVFFEHRQYRLTRSGRPAPEHRGDVIVLEQLLGFFGEGRPVAGAVFLDHLDLATQNAARCIDLVDRETLGTDRTGFADGHRAGRRVQLTDRHRGIGYRQARRVDLRCRRCGGERGLGHHRERQGGKSDCNLAACRRGKFGVDR